MSKKTTVTSTLSDTLEAEALAAPSNSYGKSKYSKIGENFYVLDGINAMLRRNIEVIENTLIIGPTGVGKTEIVHNLAKELDLPLTIFDMGTMADPVLGLVGTHTITVKDGITTSKFIRSRFSQVIQEPGIVLLDELSRASLIANNLLLPVLDFRRELSMEYAFDDQEPIKVHPKCIFIATANIGSEYSGTKKIDRALIDRFMAITIDPLPEAVAQSAIKDCFPKIPHSTMKAVMTAYSQINKENKEYNLDFSLSFRHLKMIARLINDGFTVYDGFYTISKSLTNQPLNETLDGILKTIDDSSLVIDSSTRRKKRAELAKRKVDEVAKIALTSKLEDL